jgi:hypothetical protein
LRRWSRFRWCRVYIAFVSDSEIDYRAVVMMAF